MCLQWCHRQQWLINNDVPCYGCDYRDPQHLPPSWSCFTCQHCVGRWHAIIPSSVTTEPVVVDRETGEMIPTEVRRTPWRDGTDFVVVTIRVSVDNLTRFSIRWTGIEQSEPAPTERNADDAWWHAPWGEASLCALTQTTIPPAHTCCHWNVVRSDAVQYSWDTVPVAPWHATTDKERAQWIAQWHYGTGHIVLDTLARPLIYGVPSPAWDEITTDTWNITLPDSMRTLLTTCIDAAFAWLFDKVPLPDHWHETMQAIESIWPTITMPPPVVSCWRIVQWVARESSPTTSPPSFGDTGE